jgi:uncharacterized repeat protein (TIGR03847 family)
MPAEEIDLQPVTHITTDAIGQPGKRIFYIQGWQEDRTVSLIVEKIQIQSLAVGLEQFLSEIAQRYPDLNDAAGEYQEDQMRINPPVDPMFRVGELGLGYDSDNDLVVLVAKEMMNEGKIPRQARGRYWCTLADRAMCHWGMHVASRGRPICPQCGADEPEGHFCPKRNGHKHDILKILQTGGISLQGVHVGIELHISGASERRRAIDQGVYKPPGERHFIGFSSGIARQARDRCIPGFRAVRLEPGSGDRPAEKGTARRGFAADVCRP